MYNRYREGKYPENMETFSILNTSPLEADISFCFLNDSKGETYLLEPPTMLLKPGESDKLTIWAYPKGMQKSFYYFLLVQCLLLFIILI